MKILVLGCNGMAGHVVAKYLIEKKYDVYGLARNDSPIVNKSKLFVIDATNLSLLENIIRENDFDYIINCLGILNKKTELNKFESVLINSLLPHFLTKITQDSKTNIIHISTDCVFSGKDGSYTEDSIPDSTTFYGRTKSIGEICDKKNLTIRTSIVGPDINDNGIGLFNWFMKQTGNINGYTKAIWSGITTIELAKIIELCMKQKCTGLVNMVNNDTISKYNLLKLFQKHFKKEDVNISKYDQFVENKSLIRLNNDLKYKVPDYEEMIQEMKNWVDKYKNFYNY